MANASTLVRGDESAPQQGANAPIVRNPFVRAAQRTTTAAFDNRLTAIGSSSTAIGPIDVPARGFLRSITLYVATDGTGAGGSGAAQGDAPWTAITDISLQDTNGRPLVGPLDGYDLYLINKWGGYNGLTQDPASFPSYSAVSANGEFSFMLNIPVEITSRDALGSLPNLTSAATYKLFYSINSSGNIYSTAPVTTKPAVRVKCYANVWSNPRPSDPFGIPNETTPPAVGTTQFWSKAFFNVSAGEQRIRFTRMGNHIRNIILSYYDDSATPVRIHTEFPTDWRIEWDGKILDSNSLALKKDDAKCRFGQAYDTGVVVYQFTDDADGIPGNENRHLWLPTVSGTTLEFIGTFTGTGGTLRIITNDVAVQGSVALASGTPGN